DADIAAALETGKVSRYVTDFPNDFITGKKGVIAIPHLGASTPESEDNCAKMAAKQLRDYILDGNIKNSVNLPECVLPKADGFVRVAIINKNITNMVGQITSVLANHKHNIEHMLNKSRGDYAYTLIDINEKPDDSCLDELKAIDGVIRIRVIG
ncbi:MAG: 3-phosphoglycerate dehydrogenase, partial [Ruminococcaceae bacterium]|nr:3-phosphoglycerate dehydrogenase [Oscillospiraceae bacterium]